LVYLLLPDRWTSPVGPIVGSTVTADEGGLVYYQQQVLSIVARSSIGL
jgi:hypothetical protein